MSTRRIVALAGGVGGAKLARGLADVLEPEELTVIVNTGDDFTHLGMHISPDLDTVMYTLADRHNPVTGWGLAGETLNFMEALRAVGGETWFILGDKDLATHSERTRRLAAGQSLSDVTASLCKAFGVRHRLVPMSDQPVRTFIHTGSGILEFQDYFVRHQAGVPVQSVEFRGAQHARPSPRFQRILDHDGDAAADLIVVCPSNPFLSVRPMLAMPTVRDKLARRRAPAVAVSPIVGGAAIKGPAARIMQELGMDVSALGVARLYRGLADGFVIDRCDADQAGAVAALGMTPLVTDTVMREPADRSRLAAQILAFGAGLSVAGRLPAAA
jgi:LPPG:FO 2-phospho-L-lactate transferase